MHFLSTITFSVAFLFLSYSIDLTAVRSKQHMGHNNNENITFKAMTIPGSCWTVNQNHVEIMKPIVLKKKDKNSSKNTKTIKETKKNNSQNINNAISAREINENETTDNQHNLFVKSYELLKAKIEGEITMTRRGKQVTNKQREMYKILKKYVTSSSRRWKSEYSMAAHYLQNRCCALKANHKDFYKNS